MRIAVLEAVCAGLCGGDPSPSLLAEGSAMWRALIDDLLAIPDVTVETLVDDRWFHLVPILPRLHCWNVTKFTEALMCWGSCVEDTDAAWIVAPESDGLLQDLVESLPVRQRVFNANAEAIRLCADKLALAQHLERHRIASIPTVAETWAAPLEFPDHGVVIKPRDGAGSQLVRYVDSPAAWNSTRQEYRSQGAVEAIRQPYVAGKALSVAGWFYEDGVQWFPVAEQVLGDNFVYCGGVIPASIPEQAGRAVQRLMTDAAASIPGLQGYIGFDFVLPEMSPHDPVLVEINPRLTTSCLGIRQLCRGNWLRSLVTDPAQPLVWHTDRRIEFTSEGVIVEVPLP